VIFIILLFFLVFPSSIFAAPTVSITVSPSNLSSVGVTFPVQFIIENSDINVSYHYKFYGGLDGSNTQIQSSDSLSYTSNWDSFPTITVDSVGKGIVNSYAYIKPDSLSGTYNLYVRIAKSDDHSSYYSSTAYTINLIVPTSTPTPTTVPTSTPTPTNTPTPDPTITNPSSGISLTEFMPYSDPEWLEIYNANNYPVKLVSWKIEDLDSNVKNIDSLSIPAKGYAIFEPKSLIFDNNSNEKIIFRNQDNKIINEFSYNKGQLTLDRSWSLINGNWCQSSITKGYENVTSCYITTTNTPTPSATPTPDPNTDTSKYTSTATESAIIEPKSESSFLTPTATVPTPTATSGVILGDSDTTNNTKKRNYLPLILIIGGGILLISPTVIAKIKSKK